MNAVDVRNLMLKHNNLKACSIEEKNYITKLYKSGNLVTYHYDETFDMACITNESFGCIMSVWIGEQQNPTQVHTNHGGGWDANRAMVEYIEYCKKDLDN
jgi:hypothetical protein